MVTAQPAPKISLALGASKNTKPRSSDGNSLKRPHAALQDHNDDDKHTQNGHRQTLSHFDRSAGGAIDEAKPKEEEKLLVIQPQANRDWKLASRAGKRLKSALPGANGRAEVQDVGSQVEEKGKVEYGLIVSKRSEAKDEGAANGIGDGHAEADNSLGAATVIITSPDDESRAQSAQTADQAAIDALLGHKSEDEPLTLPTLTESEAFTKDYQSAPEMATLADYDRVPVEAFGAALLRGMGWRDGEGIGSARGTKATKTKVPERRPALLGIGAKEEAAVAAEMGVWGKAARKGKEVKVYNPVLLRDRVTGEMFTEEELERRKEQAEKDKLDAEFEAEEIRRAKEKEKRRRRDEDEDNHRKSRRRDDARESDENYYRRKEKEKRRREREREDDREPMRNGERDRQRPKRHDSNRDRHESRHDRDHRR